MLEWYHGFYRPLERRLAAAIRDAPIGLDLGPRLKAPLLRADLRALGRGEPVIDGLPDCPALPDPAGPDEALGCLYVLEGATLGGRLACKQVEPEFGPAAVSFFSGYGERVGLMWKAFCAALEGHARRHPDAERVIVGAAAGTFTGFEQWLAG